MIERDVVILGSTGSIGSQSLQVVDSLRESGGGDIRIRALGCGSNVDLLRQQVKKYHPSLVSVKGEEEAEEARQKLPPSVEVLQGPEGLKRLARLEGADHVINALVGFVGLEPTLAALRAGKTVLLANKESLVIGGSLVREALGEEEERLIPIDSEHSAVFQSMRAGDRSELSRLILTASGGPFRDTPIEQIEEATPEQALDHPNWSMGSRITCDSATMVNKGFEVIEAHWLFQCPYDLIDVLIHPQSIVHSLVEFQDGSTIAELGPPDMRPPIQYALTYPERPGNEFEKLNLTDRELTFQSVEEDRYPAFKILLRAGRQGGNYPAALNGADEELIDAFLEGKVNFGSIAEGLERIYEETPFQPEPDIETLKETDSWARKRVNQLVSKERI